MSRFLTRNVPQLQSYWRSQGVPRHSTKNESDEIQKKQEARLKELINLAKQRYLATGGDQKRCPSGRKGDDYMTDEEREEAMVLMRQSAGVHIIADEVHCQGRSWKLPAV